MEQKPSILKKFRCELRALRCNRNGYLFSALISALVALGIIMICKCGAGIYNKMSVKIPAIMPSRFLLNTTFVMMSALMGAAFSRVIRCSWVCRRGNFGTAAFDLFLSALFFLLWYPLFFGANAFFFSIVSLLASILFCYFTMRASAYQDILFLVYVIIVYLYQTILILSNIVYIFLN